MSDANSFAELIKKGDLKSVQSALAQNPELLNSRNDAGQSPFLLAKYYGKAPVADLLLSLNPQLDEFENCVAGRIEPALDEADRNASFLQAHSSDGWTPLHLAAFFGHLQLAKALLNRGASVDIRSTNAMKNTPLHAAAAGGHNDLVQCLLEAGADPNATQVGGWTALHAASQNGDRPMVEILLAAGADPQSRADNNQTPLDMALLGGRGEIAEIFDRYSPTPAS